MTKIVAKSRKNNCECLRCGSVWQRPDAQYIPECGICAVPVKTDKGGGKVMEKFFGMAHIKQEGGPLHPDDIDADMTQEQWERQEQAYNEFHGIVETDASLTHQSLEDALALIAQSRGKGVNLLSRNEARYTHGIESFGEIEFDDPKTAHPRYTKDPKRENL